jgi:hypothetical protein
MSEVVLWNLALSAVGSRSLIANPNEKGREADLCRLHYPFVLDAVTKAASWPCAKAWSSLARVRERDFSLQWAPSDPPPPWRFSYAAPSDMLAPRHTVTYQRFAVGQSGESSVIFSQEEQPILHYTRKVTNPELFDRAMHNAVVFALASRLCVPLSAKDNRAAALREQAVEAILLARTEFANESYEEMNELPSWIQVRGASIAPRLERFFWPANDFNVGTI